MEKYLLKNISEYRVNTKEDADALHKTFEKAAYDNNYVLTGWTETYKEVKQKSEVVDSFYICKATFFFNDAKDPYKPFTSVEFTDNAQSVF